MLEILQKAAAQNGLVTAFAVVGLVMLASIQLSKRLTMGRVHGSAIAILAGSGLLLLFLSAFLWQRRLLKGELA